MAALLAFGFLLGVRHALEADHVAAVATLATRSKSLASTVRVAALWGLGHASALTLIGSGSILLDVSLPQEVAHALELAVGVMLVALGVDLLRRLRQKRIHLHVHRHEGGGRHFHAHSHAEENQAHDHEHGLLPRAFLVGSAHGMAGSAAVTLLSLQAIHSFPVAVTYLVLFGCGSVVGMALFAVVVSLPLRPAGSTSAGFSRGFELALGTATVALGGWIALAAAGIAPALG